MDRVGNKEVVNILKEIKVIDKYKNNVLKISKYNKRSKLRYLFGAAGVATIASPFRWDNTPEKANFWIGANNIFIWKYLQSKKRDKNNKKL